MPSLERACLGDVERVEEVRRRSRLLQDDRQQPDLAAARRRGGVHLPDQRLRLQPLRQHLIDVIVVSTHLGLKSQI